MDWKPIIAVVSDIFAVEFSIDRARRTRQFHGIWCAKRKIDNDVIVCLIAYHSLIQINELLMVIVSVAGCSLPLPHEFSVPHFFLRPHVNIMSWAKNLLEMRLKSIWICWTRYFHSHHFRMKFGTFFSSNKVVIFPLMRPHHHTVHSFRGSLLWVLWLWYFASVVSIAYENKAEPNRMIKKKTRKEWNQRQQRRMRNASTYLAFFSFCSAFHRKRLEMMRVRAHVAVINSFKYSPKNLFYIRESVRGTEIYIRIARILSKGTRTKQTEGTWKMFMLVLWVVICFIIFMWILPWEIFFSFCYSLKHVVSRSMRFQNRLIETPFWLFFFVLPSNRLRCVFIVLQAHWMAANKTWIRKEDTQIESLCFI